MHFTVLAKVYFATASELNTLKRLKLNVKACQIDIWVDSEPDHRYICSKKAPNSIWPQKKCVVCYRKVDFATASTFQYQNTIEFTLKVPRINAIRL